MNKREEKLKDLKRKLGEDWFEIDYAASPTNNSLLTMEQLRKNKKETLRQIAALRIEELQERNEERGRKI